jgi:hypothetical protein
MTDTELLERIQAEDPEAYAKILEIAVAMNTLPRKDRRKLQRQMAKEIKQSAINLKNSQ